MSEPLIKLINMIGRMNLVKNMKAIRNARYQEIRYGVSGRTENWRTEDRNIGTMIERIIRGED